MSLSNLGVEWIIAIVVILAAFGYAAFWAFNIRRKLTVKLYRHQALGIGFVAICVGYFAWGLTNNISYIPAALVEYPIDNIGFFLFLACLVPLLYWTDSSLLAARDSDPLQRDVLGWSHIRLVVWPAVVICLVAGGTYTAYELVFLSKLTAQLGNSVYLVDVPFILNIIAILVPVGSPLVAALIFLPFAIRRTKDLTLRRHVMWLGLAVSFLVVTLILNGFLLVPNTHPFAEYKLGPAAPVIVGIPLILSAYCLYRSARAVIPIYSFTEAK